MSPGAQTANGQAAVTHPREDTPVPGAPGRPAAGAT